MTFKYGDRVKYSEEGLGMFKEGTGRERGALMRGTIVTGGDPAVMRGWRKGRQVTEDCERVWWDGVVTKDRDTLHRSFLELV